MPSYLVETYLARGHAGEREARERRARSAAEELTREKIPVRFEQSIDLPGDEICFVVFDAPSTRDVGLVAPATAASSTTFTSKRFAYSVAASAVVEPQVIDVGSSVAARSTDSAGRAINYTDGRWYNADGTPVLAAASGGSAAPSTPLEPTITEVGSSVAARSTD